MKYRFLILLTILFSCGRSKTTENSEREYHWPTELKNFIAKKYPILTPEEFDIGTDLDTFPHPDTANIDAHVISFFGSGSGHLDSLPDVLRRFKNLKEISLINATIDTLQNWIGEFEHLEKLEIYDCKVKYIPKSIGNLKNLKYLILFRSHIEFIPEEMGNLSSLKELRISVNPITKYYENWGNLDSLESLDMAALDLETLPIFVTRLKNLKKIQIRENKLTDFPDEIANLTKLREMNCTRNNFSNATITRIEKLLPYCQIEFVDKFMNEDPLRDDALKK